MADLINLVLDEMVRDDTVPCSFNLLAQVGCVDIRLRGARVAYGDNGDCNGTLLVSYGFMALCCVLLEFIEPRAVFGSWLTHHIRARKTGQPVQVLPSNGFRIRQ